MALRAWATRSDSFLIDSQQARDLPAKQTKSERERGDKRDREGMAKAWEGCAAMGTVKKKVRPGKAPETAALH